MKDSFEIIPAIDILDGKCVRLTQGKFDQKEVFSNDPSEIAKKWEGEGARRIHVVDLDGAKSGKPINTFAGYLLKCRKPNILPNKMTENIVSSK